MIQMLKQCENYYVNKAKIKAKNLALFSIFRHYRLRELGNGND